MRGALKLHADIGGEMVIEPFLLLLLSQVFAMWPDGPTQRTRHNVTDSE